MNMDALDKTERLVVLIDMPTKSALTALGKSTCRTVSDLVRESIITCLRQYPIFEEVYLECSLPPHIEKEDKVIK